MPDYEFKARVLDSGLYNDYKKLKKRYYFNKKSEGHVGTLTYDELLDFYAMYPEAAAECDRIWKADHNRRTRLYRRIEKMLTTEECVFLTLTFRDDVLESTSEKTRRRYVTRYFKTQSQKYVANIDYGSLHDREHYHGVIIGRADLKAWKYGFAYAETIKCVDDSKRIGHYISKLTNHAIKETTKRNTLIYSRELFVDTNLKLDEYVEQYKLIKDGWIPCEGSGPFSS